MQENPDTTVTAATICDQLGRKEMAARLDRTVAAISNAATEGAFPTGWFLVISEMCREKAIKCPPSVFRFLPPGETQTDAGAA